MQRTFFKSIVAILPVLVALSTATPACRAWEAWDNCRTGCTSYYRGCCCCRYCDAICNFRFVDDSTHCAWRRTWYGPNALATPLSQYYIPRPPECSNCNGYKYGLVLENCPADHLVLSSDVSPDAAAGFYPARFERLGEIRNELDVAGALVTPAPRPAAPTR